MSCHLIFMTQRSFFIEHASCTKGSTNNLCALIVIVTDRKVEASKETF